MTHGDGAGGRASVSIFMRGPGFPGVWLENVGHFNKLPHIETPRSEGEWKVLLNTHWKWKIPLRRRHERRKGNPRCFKFKCKKKEEEVIALIKMHEIASINEYVARVKYRK